jgi:hypothetical protein
MIDLDKLESRLQLCTVIHLVGPNCNMSCEPTTVLELIAEVRKLRAALGWYADRQNITERIMCYSDGAFEIDDDFWIAAKDALAPSEETK